MTENNLSFIKELRVNYMKILYRLTKGDTKRTVSEPDIVKLLVSEYYADISDDLAVKRFAENIGRISNYFADKGCVITRPIGLGSVDQLVNITSYGIDMVEKLS